MLRTLTERAEAKVALQERERYLRRQNEVVADPDSPFGSRKCVGCWNWARSASAWTVPR